MNLEWRVIKSGQESGLFNTVLDEVLVEEVEHGRSPPTILFTEWRPTVSIGANQSCVQDVDSAACEKWGVEIVRRRSGGKAVYLHEGYVVFSIIAPQNIFPGIFPSNTEAVKGEICHVPERALQNLGIPARFYAPDNLVIQNEKELRTLGNAGGHVNLKSFYVHGSIRYRLSRFNEFLDVIKVQEEKLQPYEAAIRAVLTEVGMYNATVSKKEIEKEFVTEFFRGKEWTYREAGLMAEERAKVEKVVGKIGKVTDETSHISKGVCYFFLGKQNLVPEVYKVQVQPRMVYG